MRCSLLQRPGGRELGKELGWELPGLGEKLPAGGWQRSWSDWEQGVGGGREQGAVGCREKGLSAVNESGGGGEGRRCVQVERGGGG